METIGPLGAKSVDAFIVINNFGDVCSYVILVASLTASLLFEWFGASASDAWWASFSVVAPVMTVLFVFPPCLIRHFSNLRYGGEQGYAVACAAQRCLLAGDVVMAWGGVVSRGRCGSLFFFRCRRGIDYCA